MAEAKSQDKTEDTSNGNYQNYYLPEYNLSVKARSIKEAVSKADRQLKSEGEK